MYALVVVIGIATETNGISSGAAPGTYVIFILPRVSVIVAMCSQVAAGERSPRPKQRPHAALL